MATGLTPEDQERVQTLFKDFSEQMQKTFDGINAACKPLADWCREHVGDLETIIDKMKEKKDNDVSN